MLRNTSEKGKYIYTCMKREKAREKEKNIKNMKERIWERERESWRNRNKVEEKEKNRLKEQERERGLHHGWQIHLFPLVQTQVRTRISMLIFKKYITL